MPDVVPKGWGREIIFASTEQYAGKILEFSAAGSAMSLHFHRVKDETWYVLRGDFELTILHLQDASEHRRQLLPGDAWRNEPFVPHRLRCLTREGGAILEVSTRDDPADNHRIAPGDSQRSAPGG